MEYISSKKAAEQWEISERRVQFFCANGKIPGAKQLGRQWLIPDNALKPIDGRTKKAKSIGESYIYHFPIFIFSPIFTEEDKHLDKNELTLKNAQMLHMEGKYLDEIKLCVELLDSPCTTSVRVGAYTCLCYAYLLLGMPIEFQQILKKLKLMAEQEEQYREDFKLIVMGIETHLTFNYNNLSTIDTEKLSEDSLLYYNYLCALSFLTQPEALNHSEINILCGFVKLAQITRCIPSYFVFAIILASACNKSNLPEKTNEYLKIACDIADKNNWIAALSKYYYPLNTQIDKYFETKSPQRVTKIREISKRNLTNFRIITKLNAGEPAINKVAIEDLNFAILLSTGGSIEKISIALGKSVSEVRFNIDRLCTKYNCSNKKDLGDYFAKIMYNPDDTEE